MYFDIHNGGKQVVTSDCDFLTKRKYAGKSRIRVEKGKSILNYCMAIKNIKHGLLLMNTFYIFLYNSIKH